MAGPNKVKGDLLSQVSEQAELAKRILEVKGADPLSWSSFLAEFERRQPRQESAQIFQETCNRFALPGLLSNPDFIALDNPRNTGLLKLGLIVEANEKVNQSKCSTARHFFVVTASREERDYYGGSPTALFTSISKMTSRFSMLKDPPRILLRPGFPVRHKSFFSLEDDDPRSSAIHKLTYFLKLCHDSTTVNVAYEFSRCVFTEPEKHVFAGKTKDKRGFIQVLKSMGESFLVKEETVSVSDPSCVKPSLTETDFHEFLVSQGLAQDPAAVKHSEMQDVEITRARVILGDKPQRWTDFLAKLADNQSESYAETFQDRFFHAAPSGFLYSADFISRDTPRGLALIKLQFVVGVDHKLGNNQLDKISNHFNIVGTAEERKLLGKNTQMLIQALQKHTDMFHLSSASSSDKRVVRPSANAVSFETFFQMEGKKKLSIMHKLKYFLNLCGGSCANSMAYEFARSMLTREEREVFQNQQTVLLEVLAREGGTFRVTKDEVKLRSRYVWSRDLKGETEAEVEPENRKPKPKRTEEDQEVEGEEEVVSYTQRGASNDGIQVKSNKFDFTLNSTSPVPAPAEPKKETKRVDPPRQQESPEADERDDPKGLRTLTDHRVMETLRMEGYPMRWTEFKWRFMPNDPDADARITDFQRRWADKISRTLICFSPDFVALNEVRHRCRLKLQLILAARKRSANPPEIAIEQLQEHLREIATPAELDQAMLNCPSLKDYLVKFAQLFVVSGENVRQNWSALKFLGFFAREFAPSGATASVVHKLRYFQRLCGGHCTTVMACRFLQRHVHPPREQQLVDSAQKVLRLVEDAQNGVVGTNGTATDSHSEDDVEEPGKLTEQRVVNCLRGMYPMSWTEFKSRFLSKEEDPNATIARFQREWGGEACFSDRLVVTPDLVAFNMVHHRITLKLQLILEIRRRSPEPSRIPWEELEEQFKEVANRKEIVQGKSGVHFKEYLAKFAPVFLVRGEYVSQSVKALKFISFFAEEGRDASASVLNKLNYFKKLCGGHCTAVIARAFLEGHLHRLEERTLIDSEKKLMQVINSSRYGVMIPPTQEGRQEGYSDETEADTAAVVSPSVPSVSRTAEVEMILTQMGRPISWQELEGLCPANQSAHDWRGRLDDLRSSYHKSSDPRPFIQGTTYVSLNTAYDRAILKICLLVRLKMRHTAVYPMEEACEQFKNIGSITERRPFSGGLAVQLQRFPTVFTLSADNASIAPGPQMFAFDEFTSCRGHQKASCLHCGLLEFMNICGGKSHYNKAFNFMHMLIASEERRELEAAEFLNLMDQCKVHSDLDKTLHSAWAYLIGSRETDEMSVAPPQPSGIPTWPAHQPTVPHQTGSGSLDPSQKVEVTVQVIANDEHLTKLITAIQSYSRPIIAVGCTDSAVVIMDWFGEGFVVPVPEGGLPASEEKASAQWSNLWYLFQNANLVSVMFDCGAVGKFLLEKLDLQLCTVFDVKAAMELINGHSPPTSLLPCNTVAELCRSLGIPGPDHVENHITGEMNFPGADRVTALQKVSRVVQEAAALVPGVYAKIFQQLSEFGILAQLHEATSQKLAALYTTRVSSFLPDDIRSVLSGQTASSAPATAPSTTTTTTTQGPATNSMTHHLPTHQSDGSSSHSSPMNYASSGQVQNYGSAPLEPFFSSSSNSPRSLSSSPPVPLAQNGINQIANALTRIGSIQPSSNWSTISGGSTHSSQGVPRNPSFGVPAWASSYAGAQSNGVHGDTTDPLNQRGVGQHHSQGLPFSQPQLTMSHLTQNGITLGDPMNMQQPLQDDDWFSSDLEEELSGIRFEAESPRELAAGSFASNAPTMGETTMTNDAYQLTERLIQYYSKKNKESIVLLLDLLGEDIKTTYSNYVQQQGSGQTPTEIVLDVGRHAEARFHKSARAEKPVVVAVSSQPITNRDLESIEGNDALTGFDDENRCGIEGTLHSVRGVRNRKKKLIGLTIHIGLPLLGCADMMYDIAQSGKSTLILGYPGVGKTTLLRELARCLSDNEKKRVVVIDTCNEIAGDCDMPHFSIGSARRLQVPEHQSAILLESAKNHSPEVIVVDRIDSREDVAAVIQLSRGGTQIIAGTNRDSIGSLVADDILSQIFLVGDGGGGVLSDIQSLDSASALASAKFNPPFEALVEMRESGCWHVHDLKRTFSQLREGQAYTVQERSRANDSGGIVSGGQLANQRILLREKVVHPTM